MKFAEVTGPLAEEASFVPGSTLVKGQAWKGEERGRTQVDDDDVSLLMLRKYPWLGVIPPNINSAAARIRCV